MSRKSSCQADAGVVREDVDPAEEVVGRLEHPRDVLRVAHVARDAAGFTEGSEPSHGLLDPVGVARADEHAAAFFEEPACGRLADPAAGAGDQHAPALEPAHQRILPRPAIANVRSTTPARTP